MAEFTQEISATGAIPADTSVRALPKTFVPEPPPRLAALMKENYGYFGGLCLLYGLLFTICLYHNTNGITYPVLVAATIAISWKMLQRIGLQTKKGTALYVVGMILLGLGTAATTSWFFVFFNTVGILLLFLVAMLHQFHKDGLWDFPHYVGELTLLSFRTIGKIPAPVAHGFAYLAGAKEGKRKNAAAIIFGLGISLALLLIVFPMLMRSDYIFKSIFINLLEDIDLGTFFTIAFLFLTGFIASYAFFLALCSDRKAAANTVDADGNPIDGAAAAKGLTSARPKANALIGITFNVVLTLVYLLYAGIQIVSLFARTGYGLPEGTTYSEYARHGFNELLFVSILNFILVVICIRVFRENKFLNLLLTVISACTYVMIASALYRMMLYVRAYHLTFLRVLVLWFFAVLTLIMAGTVVTIYRKNFPLFRYVALVVGCSYVVFSLSRPDRHIASYNISHMQTISQTDLEYMIYDLSDDAAPVVLAKISKDQLYTPDTDADNSDPEGYDSYGWYSDATPDQILDNYCITLLDRYEKISPLQWNLAKAEAKNAVYRYRENNYN